MSSSTGSLTEATVLLTEGQHRPDLLSFAAQHGIAGHFDAENGRLVLSGKTSVGGVSDALRSIVFSMSRLESVDPTIADRRKVTWVVGDDAGRSEPAITFVDVRPPPTPRIWYTTVAVDYVTCPVVGPAGPRSCGHVFDWDRRARRRWQSFQAS